MGALEKGLVTSTCVFALGVMLVVGCSADGTGAIDDTSAVEPTPESNATLPPPSGTGNPTEEEPTKPAADAGKKDAAVDAGPPPPTPGTACSTIDEIKKKKCGACGEQSTVCLAGGDGGGGTWTDYSTCTNELAGGCTPGTVEQISCGNCGTATRTCSQYCAWSTSTCTGQPADSCSPGSMDFSTAGCGTANTYRTRSCENTCTWNAFSGTCAAPSTTVTVPATVGSVNSTIAILANDVVTPRLTGSCPTATLSTTVSTPTLYMKVKNNNAKAAVVTIYNSQAPGGGIVKTILAEYDGAANPSTEAARKACTKGVSTYGNSSLTGNSSFASLDGTTRQVTIPANGTATIYLAAYNAYDATKPADSTGPVKLNVRTESLQ
jgi:hypothetical protein